MLMIERETRPMSVAEETMGGMQLDRPFGEMAPNGLQRMLIGLARRTFLHRGKFRHLMTRLITSIQAPIDVTRYGCNYRIMGKNNLIEYGLLLHPDYNRKEIDFLVAGLRNGAALDIGSNMGLYSLPLARAATRVVSIDANKSMADRLEYNAQASGLKNLDILNVAVGDKKGKATLHVHKDDLAIVNIEEDASGTIEINTLENIINALGITKVDVLKIDIEGHEDKALAPYLNNVSEDLVPDRIVIERIGPDDYPECHKAFVKLGYEAVDRTRSNSLYMRTSLKTERARP